VKLSIIVPIYNEHSTIGQVLDRLAAVPLDKEILVVDDGSTDGSRALLEERAARGGPPGAELRVFFHERNRGKGAAIRTALAHVAGEAVIIQDADLEYDPREIPLLLEPILQGTTGIVYGSRFLGSTRGMKWNHRLANRILTLATNLLYGSRLTDEATGYKLFRADLLASMRLTCERFEFCPEVTATALKRGQRIIEVPLASYEARHLDKKIAWYDGVAALWVLIRERLRP